MDCLIPELKFKIFLDNMHNKKARQHTQQINLDNKHTQQFSDNVHKKSLNNMHTKAILVVAFKQILLTIFICAHCTYCFVNGKQACL